MWTHLTDCFNKIEKPLIAEKFVAKTIEEIASVRAAVPTKHADPATFAYKIGDKLNDATFLHISAVEWKSDPILKSIKRNEEFGELESLEIFILGAEVVQEHLVSLELAKVASRILAAEEKSESLDNWL